MCCRCCTSLKVAAIWGSCTQMVLGSILILQFFVLPELLGEYYYYYLAYICILPPLGALIFLSVVKEIGWLLKISSSSFILLQLYGLSIRLLLPMDTMPMDTFRMLQRILILFFAIVITAIYCFILIMYSRKLTAAAAAAMRRSTESMGGGLESGAGDGDAAATAL